MTAIKPALIYVASPYSHPDRAMREKRFIAVTKVIGEWSKEDRFNVYFSPIAHSHPVAELTPMPTDWAFWGRVDRLFIDRMDELVVLTLPGWEASVGVKAEIEHASSKGKPVKFVAPQPHILAIVQPEPVKEAAE